MYRFARKRLSASLLFFSFSISIPLAAVEVGPDGSANWRLPIKLPPAVNNSQPELAIAYNSNTPNGMLGVGFYLDGLAAISRVNNGRGVRYDTKDTFAGPGGRLYFVGSSAGVYHSEQENWVEYKPYYNIYPLPSFFLYHSICGLGGPCYWKATAPNGKKLYFGGNYSDSEGRIEKVGSRVVRIWALSMIEDLHGNRIYFKYDEDRSNGDYYPEKIIYNVNKASGWSGGAYIVKFIYETRKDKIISYSEGKMIMDKRLRAIEVHYDSNCSVAYCEEGSLIRSYRISYGYGLGKSRIRDIQEYGSNGSTSQPAISFTWESHSPSPVGTFDGNLGSEWFFGASQARYLTGDFNGDGLTDIFQQQYGKDDNDSRHTTEIYLSGGHLTSILLIARPVSMSNFRSGIRIIDNTNSNFKSEFRVYKFRQVAGDSTNSNVIGIGDAKGDEVRFLTGDFNGDGLTDLFAQEYNHWDNDNQRTTTIHLSRGDGTFYKGPLDSDQNAKGIGDRKGDGVRFLTGDFNGDGLTDLFGQEYNRWDNDNRYTTMIHLSNGDGSFRLGPLENHNASGIGDRKGSNVRFLTGDFNGDGLTDLFGQEYNRWDNDSYKTTRIYLSNGNGSFRLGPLNRSDNASGLGDLKGDEVRFLTGDFNGDGRTDLFAQRYSNWNDNNRRTTAIYLSNGDGTFYWPYIYTDINRNVRYIRYARGDEVRFLTGNFNDDGRTDLFAQRYSNWYDNNYDFIYSTRLYLSRGNSMFDAVTHDSDHNVRGIGNRRGDEVEFLSGDFNGDGLTDFLEKGAGNKKAALRIYSAKPAPSLIASIQNGLGATISITYTTARVSESAIANGSGYCRRSGTCGSFRRGGSQVVSQVTVNEAHSGHSYTTTYSYGRRRHYPGTIAQRADLGFEKITIHKPNGVEIVNRYYQEKRLIGELKSSTVQKRVGSKVQKWVGSEVKTFSETSYNYSQYRCSRTGCTATTAQSFAAPRQVRLTSVVEKQYDQNTDSDGLLHITTTTTNSYDSYGNLTKAKRTTSGGQQSHTTTALNRYLSPLRSTHPGLLGLGLPYYHTTCAGDTGSYNCGDPDLILNRESIYYDGHSLGSAVTAGDKLLPTKRATWRGRKGSSDLWLFTSRTFNANGTLQSETDNARGITRRYSYENSYKVLLQSVVTTATGTTLSGRTSYTRRFSGFNHKYSVATVTTDSNGLKQSMTLNALGQVTEVRTAKSGGKLLRKSNIAYYTSSSGHNYVQNCNYYGSSLTSATCSRNYTDGLGRPVRQVSSGVEGTSSRYVTVKREYDRLGREWKTYLPYYSNIAGNGSAGGYNEKTYDEWDRVTRIVQRSNGKIIQDYTISHDIKSQRHCITSDMKVGPVVETNEYQERPTSPDARRYIRKVAFYDIRGQIYRVADAYYSSDSTSTCYDYHENGLLKRVKAPTGTTTIAYNSLYQQSSISDPNTGKIRYSYYDTLGEPSFGQVKSETKPHPNKSSGTITVSNEYKASFGRLSKQTYKTGATVQSSLIENSFRYDEARAGQHNIGKLSSVDSKAANYTIKKQYAYDIEGRLTKELRKISHATEELCEDADDLPCSSIAQRSYDSLGRLTSLGYPDGTAVQYQYLAGTTALHKVKSGNTTYATYTGYNQFGQPGNIAYGNGVASSYSYSPAAFLRSIKVQGRPAAPADNDDDDDSNSAASDSVAATTQPANQTLLWYDYQFDGHGNITRITDRLIAAHSATYTYDNLKRLTGVNWGANSRPGFRYSFDKNGMSRYSQGNLMQKDEIVRRKLCYNSTCDANSLAGRRTRVTHELHWSDSNQQYEKTTDSYSYSWSAAGNMLTRSKGTTNTTQMLYDAQNMLRSVTQPDGKVSYNYYDETGQRYMKILQEPQQPEIRSYMLSGAFEYREKWSDGQLTGYQVSKYILGPGNRKIASITGELTNVETPVSPAAQGSDAQALLHHSSADNYYALAAFYSFGNWEGFSYKVRYLWKGFWAGLQASPGPQSYKATVINRFIELLFLATAFLLLALLHIRYIVGLRILRISQQEEFAPADKAAAYRQLWALKIAGYRFILVKMLPGKEGQRNKGQRGQGQEDGRGFTPFVLQQRFAAHLTPWLAFLLLTIYGCSGRPVGFDNKYNVRYSAMSMHNPYDGLPVGTYYYNSDHLGSTSLITDSDGREVMRISYTPYGEIDPLYSGRYNPTTNSIEKVSVSDSEHAALGVKFTGQSYDAATSLYYYNARYYDPRIGSFTTADSFVPNPYHSQDYNRYMYVRGNPIIYSDPSGHFGIIATILIVAAVSGALSYTVYGLQTGDWDSGNAFKACWVGAAAGAIGVGVGVVVGPAATGYFASAFWGSVIGGAAGAAASALTSETIYSLDDCKSNNLRNCRIDSGEWKKIGDATVTAAAVGAVGGAVEYGVNEWIEDSSLESLKKIKYSFDGFSNDFVTIEGGKYSLIPKVASFGVQGYIKSRLDQPSLQDKDIEEGKNRSRADHGNQQLARAALIGLGIAPSSSAAHGNLGSWHGAQLERTVNESYRLGRISLSSEGLLQLNKAADCCN